MDLNEYYRVLAKQANPDASDEDINSQLASVPADRLKAAMSPLGLPETPSSSDFDVNVSDDTVKMDGQPESLPSASAIPGTPPSTHGATRSWEPDPVATPPAPTPPAPTVEATGPNPPQAEAKPGVDALLPSESQMTQDNDARKAMLEAENKKRMLGGLASFGAGVGDAITNASTAFGGSAHSNKQEELDKSLEAGQKQDRVQFEENLKNDPNSDISRHYQKVLGLMMGKHPDDPALTKMSAATIAQTLPEVEKYMQKELQMQALKASKETNLGLRHDSEQDRLEQNARQGFMSMRGDQSLQRVEGQRDASIQAYNTISQIKKEGRMPSQIEYYDIIGQMWKARTGQAPTDQAIRDLDAKTFKGDLGKAQQYFTGAPAGRTTPAVLDNIQAFAKQSGEQADSLHDGYMKTRMVKPQNLDDSRWTPLAQAGRGTSFMDATKSQPLQASPQTKSIGGRNFVSRNGQWFEVK